MAVPALSKRTPPGLRAGHCEFLEVDELELDTSSLHTRLVSFDGKQRLLCLQQFQSPQDGLDDGATALFEDLNRLAPSVAKDFAPKISAQYDALFRLINDVYFDGEEESYIAMSYVWNRTSRVTPQKLVSPIGDLPFGWVQTVQQFPLPTSNGMFQAVLNERRVGEGLWFDQVCINQEDEVEKAAAIGTMDTIYRNARVVVAALDDVSITLEELQFLECYNQQYVLSDLPLKRQPYSGLNPPIMQQHPQFCSFVERVLSSVWFGRAWCAHEMRMGRKHVFFVPCEADPGDGNVYTIIRFTGAFFVHMLVLASEVVASSTTQYRIQSLLRHFGRSSHHHDLTALAVQSPGYQTTHQPLPSFVPTITEVFALKAGGNPRLPQHLRGLDANRDKTSMTLNISNVPLALKPSTPLQRPTTEDECLRQLLLIGLAARSPVTLCTTGAPLHLHDGSISWLCRPTPLDLPSTCACPPPAFPTDPDPPILHASDGRAEYIQLDLVFLDLPHRTGARADPRFPLHLHRARALVDLCVRCRVRSNTLWNLWQVPGHPRAPGMRNIFVQTLACVFSCGSRWLLDALSQPFFPPGAGGGGGGKLDATALDVLFDARFAVETAFVDGGGGLDLASALLDVVAVLIAHGIPWSSSATELTHGPLILSSPSSPSPSCSSAATTSTKALIFAPYAHSKTLLLAMPAALRRAEYAALARAWVLTPRSAYTGSPRGEAVCWVLRGKGVVFGGSGFVAGIAGWEGRDGGRRHRVYGPGVGE